MKRSSHLIATLSLLAGLALFVYVARRIGWHEIAARIQTIGWSFPLLLAVSALRPLGRAWAWFRCFEPLNRTFGYWTILRARLAADAMGNVTSAGPFVAEPSRVFFLGGRTSVKAASAAAAVELLSYTLSCVLLLLGGILILLIGVPVGAGLSKALIVALILTTGLLVFMVVVFSLKFVVVERFCETLKRLIPHSGFHRLLDKELHQLLELEEYVFDFFRKHRQDFFWVMLGEAVFHLAGVLEVFLALKLTGTQPTFIAAFTLEALNRLINLVFAFVPAKVGVDEAGSAWLAAALGLSTAAGVTLALYRKLRLLCWTGIGLACLATLAKYERSSKRGKRGKLD
ncbi:MAG: lysylphosphatidylglycerol synthase domain-containing protein [Acidobacteriota bacterium]|nr:lysylphosphatidylglycerol synthase domain-containing protein [Acidobacteriota bacterium]